MSRPSNPTPPEAPGPWSRFWFSPADPFGLHVVRVATGLVLLFWLLTLTLDAEALFSLNGWFDSKAYLEASRQPTEMPRPLTWSLVYLCGESAAAFRAFYWGGLGVVALFTLGLLPRLTGVLTWLFTLSLTASPAFDEDVEVMFRILTLYLALGYLLAGPWTNVSSMGWLFGSWRTFLFARRQGNATPSVGVNVALRLIQVHLAIVVVTSGLHKLQSSAWWSGVVHWYFLMPPLEAMPGRIQQLATSGLFYMTLLNVAAYATLAWQLAFPMFAWRSGWWRAVLFGGAAVGWVGLMFVYRMPLFGPVLLTACLAYLDASEWQQVRDWLARFTARIKATLPEKRPAPRVAGLLLAGVLCCPACAPSSPPDPPREGERPPFVLPPEDVKPAELPASPFQRRIEAAIRNVRARTLLRSNAFWTVFHGILGLGPGVRLVDPRSGERVNALDYLCDGGELRGLTFQPTDHGVEVVTYRDGQGQGHQDQFIAEMAQWGMPAKKRMRVQGRDRTFLDFVKNSQMRARTTADQELSWTIVVVAQYLGTDAEWTNQFGEKLRLEDLVRYEVEAPVVGAPCGGTHRLFGLTWAYHLHLAKGGKSEGVWADVASHTTAYAKKARQFQNPDGTFSTASFEGRAQAPDKQLQINTTGHTLEWLALALPDHELRAEWMELGVSALCQLILDLQDAPIDGGSMYHAVHGLYLYHARRFGRSFAPPELTIPLPPGWGDDPKLPKR